MPTSAPPRKTTRRAARSTPPSPASSDDDDDVEGDPGRPSSPFSLMPPDFPGFHPKGPAAASNSRKTRPHSADPIKNKSREDLSSLENTLSPWEEWFLCKEKELRARFQAQALEAMNQEMEKMKEEQEREKKKVIAAQKHKEWVQRKNEEVKRERRERERKLSKEMAEKAAKDLKKAQSREKAREMYQEWLKKKNAEDVQKKREEKEKERQREAELQEKRVKSEKMFKEWLQNPRHKTRPTSAVYAYTSRKPTGLPDRRVYPAPSFYNPIPWKPIQVPPPKEEKYVSVKKNKRPMSSHTYRSSPMFFHKSNNIYIGPLCRIQR